MCDGDLRIWHLFVGSPGSLNGFHILNQSPLYLDVTAGRWPPRDKPSTVNGSIRTLPYYLVDGMYSRYAFLVSPHPMPIFEEAKTFNRLQEATREDVGRLFGVLTKQVHIALHQGRYCSMKQLITTYKAVCILHNMFVECLPDAFLSRRRRARGTNDGAGGEGEIPAGAAAAGTRCCRSEPVAAHAHG